MRSPRRAGAARFEAMALPIVHHPAYVAPMPAGHRFPMAKFGRLMAYLLEEGVVGPPQVRVPELAPPEWLTLAHAGDYVSAVLTQTLDAAAVRRIGLPITLEVARRARAANAGTVLTARLALEHGLACNTAIASNRDKLIQCGQVAEVDLCHGLGREVLDNRIRRLRDIPGDYWLYSGLRDQLWRLLLEQRMCSDVFARSSDTANR
jgi:hypothetical protein